jgi:Pyruvate/2-oxoacid:ferredoxin oxidoreductase delta subunit
MLACLPNLNFIDKPQRKQAKPKHNIRCRVPEFLYEICHSCGSSWFFCEPQTVFSEEFLTVAKNGVKMVAKK